MRTQRLACCCLVALLLPAALCGAEVPALSPQTQACVACHEAYHPGIVADWRSSRHSRTTPRDAVGKPELERRVTSPAIPQELQAVAVGCYECHSRNLGRHRDAFDHMGFRISAVVSPNDCATCHATEAEQYSSSKKAHALDNLRRNPVFETLVTAALAPLTFVGERVVPGKVQGDTRSETCYACHGTEVRVRGMRTVTSAAGEMEVPDLSGWPNQGVGRSNPDGSQGACTACHPRHSFAIEIARKPQTCAQCHLEPDTPAWEVYRESKHGNIILSGAQDVDWDEVPWTAGTHFRAPTCATCHNSLVVTPGGETVAARTHDFGARLWVRLFGLPYAHPQPRHGATWQIRNRDGLPLPTRLTGEPAASFVIDSKEQAQRRARMVAICRVCHSTAWAEGHFARLDASVAETNRATRAGTRLLEQAWKQRRADPAVPFDEPIERRWVEQWLFYATSIRYASAMAGPDYASFKNGWWALSRSLRELHQAVRPAAPAPAVSAGRQSGPAAAARCAKRTPRTQR